MIYFAIAFLVPELFFKILNYFELLVFVNIQTITYLKITSTVFICVILNPLLRDIVYRISPARIKSSEKLKPYELDKLTDYVLSIDNVRFLVYGAYVIALLVINYFNLQGKSLNSANEIDKAVLQSFVTFIAFDRTVALMKQLNFRPSGLLNKIYQSILNKMNTEAGIETKNNKIMAANQNYENYQQPNWWSKNWVEFTTIVGGLIAINLIFIAKVYRVSETVNPETAGQLGNFVGGYIGTIFALIGVVFLYSTLKNQRETSQVEKFENKYFELIKLQRDNVSEIGIGEDFGRKIFVILIREFRAILQLTSKIALRTNQSFSQEQVFIISYYALFFGVGPNSSRLLKEALKDQDKTFVDEFDEALKSDIEQKKAKTDKNLKFRPFGGHQSRLGHYYRHLYQTVSYVNNQSFSLDKYEYVKNIRAQLTTHEQALLYINSLTPLGSDWWKDNLIVNYRIVQNIPSGFFDKDTEIDLPSYFPKDYFEWQKTN
ncbi:MAG: putative phage abortive infection protein [Bacteroidetes bacterium]|nr:putative phage abortive infection protein [Bacteroidota bacterium]